MNRARRYIFSTFFSEALMYFYINWKLAEKVLKPLQEKLHTATPCFSSWFLAASSPKQRCLKNVNEDKEILNV